MSNVIGTDALQSDVAAVLEMSASDLSADQPLVNQGLDSIRLMALVERWRARGVSVRFADLADRPTLAEWGDLLSVSDNV